MRQRYIIAIIGMLLLNACAGRTTDPRQGGLFSYNPNAYEQRLATGEQELTSIEEDTIAQKRKSISLKKKLLSEKSKMQ